jgi:thiopeptide-type bacteriocin biosynthesis protein
MPLTSQLTSQQLSGFPAAGFDSTASSPEKAVEGRAMKKTSENKLAGAGAAVAEEKKVTYAASGFFVMRTPLLPFGKFLRWGDALGPASSNDVESLTQSSSQNQTGSQDRAALRDRLRAIVAQPEISDAIFVASPDLYDYLDQWLTEPESKRGQRVEGALVRYFSRMCGRSTPFGLFAANSLGKVGPRTQLTIPSQAQCQRHTRLDMDYLFALVDALGHNAEVRQTLTYRPNSSLYTVADRVRYVESRVNGRARTYHLVAVEKSEGVEFALRRAEQGATIAELASALLADLDDEEITVEEAIQFIEQLIDNQILVADLALPVTGAEAIHPLIAQLRQLEAGQEAAIVLEQTRDALAAIDAAGLGATPEAYRRVAARLETLPAKVELPRLFQVDMIRPPSEATLGEAVIQEISKGVEALHRIFGKPVETELDRFKKAFTARYEGREVPLVEVLDDDLGIGFPAGGEGGNAPLLNGLAFPARSEWAAAWQAHDAFLLRKCSEAWMAGAAEINLCDEDIKALQSKERMPLPNSFAVMCRLAATSAEAVERGEFQIWLEAVAGPTGATLLGRFCHADAELHKEVAQYLQAEEAFHPDAVFAELAHLPEGRIGNVLARPVLRDYEIPYLGNSGAARDRQLSVTDLLLSVQEGRIVLRSARLGCEVMPRLTSAHNWGRESSTVYRFLGELQTQGASGVMWNWGALDGAPFLPRVTYGRVMLSPAQWAITEAELKRIAEAASEDRFCVAGQWRAERKLPRFVVLADGDNTLPVDLENALSVDSFAHIVKGRSNARLQELWPAPEQLCAQDTEGAGYVHELVVPFLKQKDGATIEPAPVPPVSPSPHLPIPRSFPPGSEWLYAKIYCGAVTADQVIREVLAPVAKEVMAEGAADQWFFLRYNDPGWHVRVRFHGQPDRLRKEVWPRLQMALQPMLEDGRVWRVQLDTYEREIERYGSAAGIELSEQISFADSVAAAELVSLLDQGDASADERWQLALCGMDRMLNDFGFNLVEKADILKTSRASFLAEFKADEALMDQLGERYRQERKTLEALLDPSKDGESQLAPGLEVFAHRSIRLRVIAEELRTTEREGRLTTTLVDIIASHLHMQANRLLRSSHRAQEMVIYDLLTRLYSSQLARQRQAKSDSVARRAA